MLLGIELTRVEAPKVSQRDLSFGHSDMTESDNTERGRWPCCDRGLCSVRSPRNPDFFRVVSLPSPRVLPSSVCLELFHELHALALYRKGKLLSYKNVI